MKSWLKFFFGSFFDNRQANTAPKHRLLNAALAFLIGIVLFYIGLAVGFLSSFGTHYDNSSRFNAAVKNLFTLGGEGKLSVKTENNRALSGVNGEYDNGFAVNTFDSEDDASKYRVDGYDVIFDTRPLETTYDDFTAYCVDKQSGERIPYEEYKNGLTDEEKSRYDFTVEFSGRALELTEDKLNGYSEYLKGVCDEGAAEYDADICAAYTELEEKRADTDEYAYACALYELYVRAYYPSLNSIERYGKAPTLRSYYAKNILSTDKAKNYIAVFDDSMFGHFVTDGGVAVGFNGRYTSMNGFELTGDNADAVKRSADEFIAKAFGGMKGSWMSLYMINVLQISPMLFLAWVVCTLVIFVACKVAKSEYGATFGGSFAIVGSFLLVSFFLAFIGAIILGFTVTRDVAYGASIYLFCGILLLRTVIHVVIEGIKQAKEKRLERTDE